MINYKFSVYGKSFRYFCRGIFRKSESNKQIKYKLYTSRFVLSRLLLQLWRVIFISFYFYGSNVKYKGKKKLRAECPMLQIRRMQNICCDFYISSGFNVYLLLDLLQKLVYIYLFSSSSLFYIQSTIFENFLVYRVKFNNQPILMNILYFFERKIYKIDIHK